ncbi:MAG TPA: Uma2 family endonuclease [Blastocatellia bacterium]|jgi:Uma2 family endonuclease|nr:Uma2 family endonuclease [Blastocatellia bacterium]
MHVRIAAKTMSVPKGLQRVSVEEYLEGEKDGLVRHEYVDGQVFAMAGASDRHNRISLNLAARLDGHVDDGPCEVFIADMKVSVSESVFYYPDVVVACDGPAADPYYRKQPRLIIEVTSPGTERIDRSEKLVAYKRVKSLKEYVIVAQDRAQIEVFRRGRGDRWSWQVLTEPSDELKLESVGLTLTVAQVYRRVKLPRRARR